MPNCMKKIAKLMILTRNVILASPGSILCPMRGSFCKGYCLWKWSKIFPKKSSQTRIPPNFGLKKFFQKKKNRYFDSNLVKFGGQNGCPGTHDHFLGLLNIKMMKMAKRDPRRAQTVLKPCGNAFSAQKTYLGTILDHFYVQESQAQVVSARTAILTPKFDQVRVEISKNSFLEKFFQPKISRNTCLTQIF